MKITTYYGKEDGKPLVKSVQTGIKTVAWYAGKRKNWLLALAKPSLKGLKQVTPF